MSLTAETMFVPARVVTIRLHRCGAHAGGRQAGL
jgi:hypothetical protein